MTDKMKRLSRLRKNKTLRALVSETKLQVINLIMPYFVVPGKSKKENIAAMPGIARLSIDNLLKDIEESKNLGIQAILLFGLPQKKDKLAKGAYSENGIIQQAVRAIKKRIKDVTVITDVCLCGYTTNGHCGILTQANSKRQIVSGNPRIDNDATSKILAKIALSHAQAGADIVAPSAMMDAEVRVIRDALDKGGFQDALILAYSAKFASNFYAPFREALDSRPAFGDRKSYQLDFRNARQALAEIEQDITEGADIVMVKPALAYLDIIAKARQKFNLPIAAYNVSGEYAMIKSICKDRESEKSLVKEVLTGIKRAGADLIISYHAKDLAKWSMAGSK